jgi:uncharacterized repeat protein (TIGR01451 family)
MLLRRFTARHAILKALLAAVCVITAGVGGPSVEGATALPGTVPLGTAGQFAVLGGQAVTNTGSTVVNGDLGISPGNSVTGFPPGVVNGVMHVADAVAANAQSDLVIAYNDAAGRAPDANLSGQDLGGMVLTAGVYKYDVAAQLTGTVTLDAQGDSNAVFIFQIGSTLTTATNASVSLVNGAQACHVFWQIGSSATLGTTTTFAGSILALTSITANTGTTVEGRLLARNGAVTADTNTINRAVCAGATIPDTAVTKTASPTSQPAPGGVFTFTVTVTNNGTAPATLTSLTDSVYGDLNGQGTCATGGTVLAGDTYTCAFQGTFNGFAGDSETDTVVAVLDAGGQAAGQDDATVTLTASPTGILEICKRADDSNGPVSGKFTFGFLGRTVTVPVGSCTGPIRVPAGNITVTEAATSTTQVTSCETRPATRLVSCDPAKSTAVVTVPAGGVSNETILSVSNRLTGPSPTTTTAAPGTPGNSPIKVCKIAGRGVAVGTPFKFTVGSRNLTVRAGPADQGGYCRILYGFPIGQRVTITEAPLAGVVVSAIAVDPAARRVSSNNAKRTVTISVGRRITVVSFTNSR